MYFNYIFNFNRTNILFIDENIQMKNKYHYNTINNNSIIHIYNAMQRNNIKMYFLYFFNFVTLKIKYSGLDILLFFFEKVSFKNFKNDKLFNF